MPGDQAPVIIYRTKADFYSNVPVILNEEKTKIISYPAPSDLLFNGELLLPAHLKDGYLLDRRGLNVNAAFTSYTFEAYSALENPPSLDELFNSIVEKDPFESIYHCGQNASFVNLEKELNRRIRRGMRDCTPLIH